MSLIIIGIYSYYTEIFSTLPEIFLQKIVYWNSAFKFPQTFFHKKKEDALKQGYFFVQTSSNNYDLISFPASTM